MCFSPTKRVGQSVLASASEIFYLLPMNDETSPIPTAELAEIPKKDLRVKCSQRDWDIIKALAESGRPYDQIAELFPVTTKTIYCRASSEQWATPLRISKAANGKLSADDPASAAAMIWKERGKAERENIYKGASKALERFFALSPIPLNFQEAAIAAKLMDSAISPPSESDSKGQVNLAILTHGAFIPSPTTVDV